MKSEVLLCIRGSLRLFALQRGMSGVGSNVYEGVDVYVECADMGKRFLLKNRKDNMKPVLTLHFFLKVLKSMQDVHMTLSHINM